LPRQSSPAKGGDLRVPSRAPCPRRRHVGAVSGRPPYQAQMLLSSDGSHRGNRSPCQCVTSHASVLGCSSCWIAEACCRLTPAGGCERRKTRHDDGPLPQAERPRGCRRRSIDWRNNSCPRRTRCRSTASRSENPVAREPHARKTQANETFSARSSESDRPIALTLVQGERAWKRVGGDGKMSSKRELKHDCKRSSIFLVSAVSRIPKLPARAWGEVTRRANTTTMESNAWCQPRSDTLRPAFCRTSSPFRQRIRPFLGLYS